MKVKGLLLILIICFLAIGLVPQASADNKPASGSVGIPLLEVLE